MGLNPFEVSWCYKVLLGREPESRSTIDEACQEPTLDSLRKRLMRSLEFQSILTGGKTPDSRFQYQEDTNLLADLVWHSKMSRRQAELAYKAVVKRDLQHEDGIENRLNKTPNLYRLLVELLDSDERRDAENRRVLLDRFTRGIDSALPERMPKRVLLFGAFGNGNVGDGSQVEALVKLLVDAGIGAPTCEIVACSWERALLPTVVGLSFAGFDAILDPSFLRSADLLLIGGGGLLSTPHFPLFSHEWAIGLNKLKLPYALVGVGASSEELSHPDRTQGYQQLVRGAKFVTARDESSFDALMKMRSDVELCVDPYILANAEDATLYAAKSKKSARVLLIPKSPVNPMEISALEQMRALSSLCKRLGIPASTLVFEPNLDGEVLGGFENVITAESSHGVLEQIRMSRRVYSMRYHGTIFSLLSGVSCWSMGAPKLRELCERAGIPKFFSRPGFSLDQLMLEFETSDWNHVRSFLSGINSCKRAFTTKVNGLIGDPINK